jgi:3-hydroxyisobutyrate dehydrogenase
MAEIVQALAASEEDFAVDTLRKIKRNDPLAMACTVEMLHRLRAQTADVETALEMEYRFTSRAMEDGDFLEGIRAAIIEKDKAPKWQHKLGEVSPEKINAMLAPLGAAPLQ